MELLKLTMFLWLLAGVENVPSAWFGTVFGQIVGHDHLGVRERGKSGFDVWISARVCVIVCTCVCVCVCVCYVCVCQCARVCVMCVHVCVLLSVHLLE